MPRLQVLMPARNSAETVGKAVQSTIRALPEDSEILLWDDASSDSTVERAEAAASRAGGRLRVFSISEAVGTGAALNRLLQIADCSFIARMDSDDVCLPWRFRAQLPHVETGTLVFSSAAMFPIGHLRYKLPKTPRLQSNTIKLMLLIGNRLVHPTLTCRLEDMTALGGYSTMPKGQDYELWLRAITRQFNFISLAMPSIAYRITQTQSTRQPGYGAAVFEDPRLYKSYYSALRQVLPGFVSDSNSAPGIDELRRELESKARCLSGMQSAVLTRALHDERAFALLRWRANT